jgi:hypothetical protein
MDEMMVVWLAKNLAVQSEKLKVVMMVDLKALWLVGD